MSQTCGQQKFSRPTLLLWLVCSEQGWKNVKRHLTDQVSREGRTSRGGERRQCVGGLHWPNRDQRKPRRERRGQAVQHCASQALYLSLLSLFKNLLPKQAKDTSALLNKVDVRLRPDRKLIQDENNNNTPSHMDLAHINPGCS